MSFFTILLAALGVSASTSVDGILNFSEVIPGKVYRGGQPSRDGWQFLKDKGIKTILKLNYNDEGADDAPFFAYQIVSMPPRDLWQSVGIPDMLSLYRAVEVLASNKFWPIYVHCLHGQDRTGFVVAMFRVMYQGYRVDKAYDEMLAHGFHADLLDLQSAWEKFAAGHKS